MEANASAANVTINVPAGTYNLTITSGAEEDASASNDLDITNSCSTTITGAGTGQDVIINASAIAHRVFDLLSGANLSLKNMTITNGNVDHGQGGGIRVRSGATLDLDHVIITGNQASYGGGIFNAGTVTGTLVSITLNRGSAGSSYGGGIFLAGTSNNDVTLTRSLIYGNQAQYGGGIANWGNGNYYSPGGGTLYLENVTIGQNSASGMGAGVYLYQGSRSYFVNCTIAYNVNSSGSSGAGIIGSGANSFDFLNTLVFQNENSGGVNNCYQISQSSSLNHPGLNDSYFVKNVPYGHNVEDSPGMGNDYTKCFNNDVSNILLDTTLTTSAALAGAGTYKLQTGSAAIDAGDPANYAALDVFGTARPQGSAPDIGAYEFDAYEFANANEPPTTPVLTGPADNHHFRGNKATLYWQKSTDPEGKAVTYIVQVAEDAYFSSNLQTFHVDGTGSVIKGRVVLGAAVLLPFFVLLGWRRKNGIKQMMMMLMMIAMLLTTPLLMSCGSGDKGQTGASNSYYNYGEGNPFSGADAGKVNTDKNTITFNVSGLKFMTRYYWRVIAVDDKNSQSAPSEIRSFTTGSVHILF